MALTSLKNSFLEAPVRKSLESYVLARSALYAAEGWVAPAIELLVRRTRPRLPSDNPIVFTEARRAVEELLRRDIDNIMSGLYPLEVLKPESPLSHFLRFPELLREGIQISRRRSAHNAHDFSPESREFLKELPEYYRRNFHFQGSGYLTSRSARLYEHQVDVLFAGTADAMRRLILAPLRKRFGSGDGEGLQFLEVASGTGRATRFVRLAFPKAKITSLDLSSAYLKRAQRELHRFARHDFVEGDAAALPFKEDQFDAVYSVFLFHELPFQVRLDVVSEGLRVLKKNGFYAVVDSLQLGDVPIFDQALEQFPKEFHEPYYKNYLERPLETIFLDRGLTSIATEFGFFAKVCSGLLT